MELAGALRHHGTEITLMTMGAPLSQSQWEQIKRLGNIDVFETDYQLEWMDDPWRDVDSAGRHLLQLESQVEPDVVHLNGFSHGALHWHTPVLVVAHSCVLSWWKAVKGESAPSKYDIYQQRVSEGLRAADMVVAPTWSMLAGLEEHYGFSGRKKVIFNGSQKHALPQGTKDSVIMAAGRLWDEAKNFLMLDRVAPRLKWPVFIAGDPSHPNGSCLHFENINRLGHLPFEVLVGHLKQASLFVHPARYEPFGLSVLEAALSGCALVLGDIPSLRELWSEAAIFVSPDDEQSLEHEISALIDSPARIQEMGCRAQQRALRYSATEMADRYISIYSDLILSRMMEEVPR